MKHFSNYTFHSKLIMLVLALAISNVCLNTYASFLKETPNEKLYRRGKTTLKIRQFPEIKGLEVEKFNHPYFIKKNDIVDVLSSIYYKDRNVLKTVMTRKVERKPKRVFQGDEIEKLTPLIIDALSKATPDEDLLVTSLSERFLLEGLTNGFSLFMTGETLNIVFGSIRKRGTVGKSQVINVRKLKRNAEPLSIKKSHYWDIYLKPGQRFKPGRQNWLLIDFKNTVFAQAVEKNKIEIAEKYKKGFRPIVDPLEARIKKLEKLLEKEGQTTSVNSTTDGSISSPYKEEPLQTEYYDGGGGFINPSPANARKESSYKNHDRRDDYNNNRGQDSDALTKVTEAFHSLRELRDENLITEKDYEIKKNKLLDSFPTQDVKASLKKLKMLNESRFITDQDFERAKALLLENM